jgi:hypothetical protein
VFTPEQHRAEVANYTESAKQGNAPNEMHKFLRHEQSLTMLADNEQWLADNHDNLANNLDRLVQRFRNSNHIALIVGWAKSPGTADVTTLGATRFCPRGPTKPRVPTAWAKAHPPS